MKKVKVGRMSGRETRGGSEIITTTSGIYYDTGVINSMAQREQKLTTSAGKLNVVHRYQPAHFQHIPQRHD